MARSVVVAPSRWLRLGGIALGPLLFGTSGCRAFEPVAETRFVLLNTDTYKSLGMPYYEIDGVMHGPQWVVYDDQHSDRFSCINGAAGRHSPEDCSRAYKKQPWGEWDACPADGNPDNDGKIDDPGSEGVYFQGVRAKMQKCVDDDDDPNVNTDRCYRDDKGHDVANMWGAGIGLNFSYDGTTPWNPDNHDVIGVAFEFVGQESVRQNLRVGISTELDDNTALPEDRPLIRNDGSVLDRHGKVYRCDSTVTEHVVRTDTMADVRVGETSSPLTSGQHPFGSSFWQQGTNSSWTNSPVVDGQNRFEWDEVLPPPLPLPPSNSGKKAFKFDRTRVLGIHFQVVYQVDPEITLNFEFRIKNLALILK